MLEEQYIRWKTNGIHARRSNVNGTAIGGTFVDDINIFKISYLLGLVRLHCAFCSMQNLPRALIHTAPYHSTLVPDTELELPRYTRRQSAT